MPRERNKIFFSVSSAEFLRTAKRVAGMIRDAEATAIREDIVDATVELKFCSIPDTMPVRVFRMPPAIKQHPSTRRIFDRILPSMLDWTILISPFLRATILTYEIKVSLSVAIFKLKPLTISSTALPNVALSNPPNV